LQSADNQLYSLFAANVNRSINPNQEAPVPTLKLTGGKPATRKSAPKATTARKSPARKPAAKSAATRKPATSAAKASTNGAATRGPKLPEGWTKADFNQIVTEMQAAHAEKVAATEALADAQEAVNSMALDLISQGIQMSVVSTELNLSRQWLYKIMEDAGVKTARQAAPKSRASKPAAKRRPAAKAAAKPTAKRSPARKRPASPATTGRGRVHIAR
jgi:DNA-binding phage protein